MLAEISVFTVRRMSLIELKNYNIICHGKLVKFYFFILLKKTLIGTWVLRGVQVRDQVVWNAR